MDDLTFAARGTMTALVVAFAFAARRALLRTPSPLERPLTRLIFGVLALGLAFTFIPALLPLELRIFPVGLAVGLTLAAASLFAPRVRDAFDQLSDGDVRLLVGARAGFGALLIALAATSTIPATFARTAGVGDIVVGALAIAAPGTLDRSGSPVWRGIVHGVGIADLLQVVFLAVTVVRPFLLAKGEAPITMALPWLVVPLMVAVDLHGIRKALGGRAGSTRPLSPLEGKPEPRGDGSEPAGGVRRTVPGA